MDNKSYEEEVEGIVLPEWLTGVFPEHLPWSVISFNAGKFKVGHDGSEFPNIIEAYDYACSFKDEYQVILHSSVDGQGGELMDGFYFCDAGPGASSSRLLLSHATQDTVTILKHDYRTWLTDGCIAYSLEPDNFFIAHQWLTYHPVFWRKRKAEKSFSWDIAAGLHDATVSVRWNEEENKPGVCLEAGAHLGPEYMNYCRDNRLTSYATTYEEAIIMLAKKVNEVFDVDGNERSEK